jgi:hypothetical protein
VTTELIEKTPASIKLIVESKDRVRCQHYHSEITGEANKDACTGQCKLYEHNTSVSHVCGVCGKSW